MATVLSNETVEVGSGILDHDCRDWIARIACRAADNFLDGQDSERSREYERDVTAKFAEAVTEGIETALDYLRIQPAAEFDRDNELGARADATVR